MALNITDIINYFEIIEKKFDLNISFHSPSCSAFLGMNVAKIGKYNSHCNPYCTFIKSNPQLNEKCICQQRIILNRKNTDVCFGMAHCGLEEFIIPIVSNNTAIGFISVGGFCTNRDKSIRRINKISSYVNKKKAEALLDNFPREAPDISDITALFRLCADSLAELMKNYYRADVVSPKTNQYSEMLSYITLNYKNKITAKDIAAHCYCSESYVNHTFKRISGTSINQYVNSMRIKQAEKLLSDTSLTSAEIAASVGFSDANYFSNVFKKIYGSSPRKFKKLNEEPKS